MLKSWNEFVKNYENHIQDEQIECYAQKEKQFFITHEGLVWPCCFLHNAKYRNLEKWKEYTDRFDLNYEKNWNNLYYKSFNKIINHDFYKNDLVKSWKSKIHGTKKCNRLIRCTQTCSKTLINIGNHKVLKNKD